MTGTQMSRPDTPDRTQVGRVFDCGPARQEPQKPQVRRRILDRKHLDRSPSIEC